jgi:hypothetical protein
MKSRLSAWELYERMIARMISDQLSTDLCVTPNARIVGKISGRSRQIDVLIETRHTTNSSMRVIVDAKRWRRKINVADVEAFRGMMEDVGATHGYLVCPNGYSRAAETRAQRLVSIRIVPLSHLENFDPSTWPICRNEKCNHGRVFWDGYPEISTSLAPINSRQNMTLTKRSFVHYVGKCDRCGRFHVQCMTCGDILAPHESDDEDIGHQCSCKPPWFWLASTESDSNGGKSAELHAIMINKVITVDRRSL